MNLQSDHSDDFVLPSWMGKVFGFLVLLVALGVIYYGVHDGIIDQNIAFRTKAGEISIGKGLVAVIIGVAFSGIGIALVRVASLIFKSSKAK